MRNAQVFLGKAAPEVVQPMVVEHKAADVRLVFGVNSLGDGVGRLPRADPKDLTFAPTETAAAEVRECLIKDAARQAVNGRHYPPLTTLGRSSNSSCGFTPASSMVWSSLSST